MSECDAAAANVADVEPGGEEASPVRVRYAPSHDQQGNDYEEDVERWKDAKGASDVEVLEVDPSSRIELADQEPGDQKAAQSEEQLNAKGTERRCPGDPQSEGKKMTRKD